MQRVEEFARRLGLTETVEPYLDLLSRDDDRARRREAVEHAQVLQLRIDLLERAGGKLAAASSDAEALATWDEALRD